MRPDDYHLSQSTRLLLGYLHTRLGSAAHAKMWRTATEAMDSGSEDLRQERAVLVSLARSVPELAPIISPAIARLDHTGSMGDRIFYNTIIEALAAKQHYQQVFAVYHLMLKGSDKVLPDAYTFGTLFRIVSFLSRPRTLRSRKHKRPTNTPTLRQLFREMTRLRGKFTNGRSHRASSVVNTSILNKALSAFMQEDDYVAAFLVLRSFTLCRVSATVDTYRVVVGELLRRIQHELPYIRHSEPDIMWTYRFLGHKVPMSLSIGDDVRLLDGILRLGLQSRLSLEPLQLGPPALVDQLATVVDGITARPIKRSARNRSLFEIGEASCRLPAPLVILGFIEPLDDHWLTTPLERILRRAILATFTRILVPPAKAVSMAISDAKEEMVYRLRDVSSELYNSPGTVSTAT